MVLYHIQESYDQFVIIDGDDIVQVLLDVREDIFSWGLYCGTVGDGVYVRKCYDLTFSRDTFMQAAPAGSTPMTLICGLRSFARVETPVASPPPPIGTRM